MDFSFMMKHSSCSSGTSIHQLCKDALPWAAEWWLLKITLPSFLPLYELHCMHGYYMKWFMSMRLQDKEILLTEMHKKQDCGVTTNFNHVFKSMKQLICNLLLWLQDLPATTEGMKYWETPKCATVRDIRKSSTIRRQLYQEWLL